MAKLAFTKMHGIGNDYIMVDCTQQDFFYDPGAVARALSPRHFAVGSDGLVLILPGGEGDYRMRIYNADGSEAGICGNAARCVGKYVFERGLTTKTEILLETQSGVKALQLHMDNVRAGVVSSITVDMGKPSFKLADLPAAIQEERWVGKELDFGGYAKEATLLSMGNPHAVLFYEEDVRELDLRCIGPLIEHSSLFPQRVNAEFVRILNRDQLDMRVWERGSGETMACGSGACAAAVAAMRNDRCNKKVSVHLMGGSLDVEWKEADHVYMTGPAAFCYNGTVDDALWL